MQGSAGELPGQLIPICRYGLFLEEVLSLRDNLMVVWKINI